MATVIKTVDKTLVAGSQVFIYTFHIAYSGLTQPAQNGSLTDFFPSKINFALPQTGGQIVSISKTPVAGGTNVTFHFGAVTAGTSFSFTISCSFGNGRVNNDSFTNTATLFADGVQVAQASAPPVVLTLTEAFFLSKTTTGSYLVRPNQVVQLALNVIQGADPGSQITNVNITDVLPAGLSPDLTFTPIGNDVPSNGFSDPTSNGLTGTWSGNTLHFTIPSYSGYLYRILFQVIVGSNVTPGTFIQNTATWSVNAVARAPASYSLKVFSPSDAFALTKSASATSYVGGPIYYSVGNANRDIVPYSNYALTDTIPPQVDIHKIRFISTPSSFSAYNIYITTSANPTAQIPVITNGSGGTGTINLTPYIPSGARVLTVTVSAPTLPVSGNGHSLNLYGTINSTATNGQIVINNAAASADGISLSVSASTTLNSASDLLITKSLIPQQSAYYPLQEFQFSLRASTNRTLTIDPVIADLIPVGLQYEVDSEYFVYLDTIDGVTYDSRNPGFPVPLPARDIIENFAGTGQTLVRWRFNDFTLPLPCSLIVYPTVFVEIDPPSSFTNIAYEGNPGNNVLTVGYPVKDVNDIDGDGITNENIASSTVSGTILTTSAFLLQKMVKGGNDLGFGTAGSTTAGGNITYRLMVTNNQLSTLTNIAIVDILPYVGDTGVILTNQQRGSQFNVYATAAVTAQIVNMMTGVVVPDPDITIQYSTSTDPLRFDVNGNPIGTGTWSLTPPTDITTLAAIRVTTGTGVVLNSYDRLIITINAVAPVGVAAGQSAYNSFAVMADEVLNGVSTPMNPTEPNKVAVTIVSQAAGSIGNFVWVDENGNGLYDPGEPGVNGVTVQLYDGNNNLLQTTVTANNSAGQPGYYLFTNLNPGSYFVKFTPFGTYTLTIQQTALPNGSKPNETTGLTNQITLATNQVLTTINAGMLLPPCAPPVITAYNRCLNVGDAFDPMDGVTATNCAGQDITAKIIITQNTVNTQVPGVYSVTYSVTDSRNQTTTKTIAVKVCTKDARHQAISDLFTSAALEQVALSHILNAEGKKIQKAKALKLSAEEMLAINGSVKGMTDAVTRLELALQGKLSLFNCDSCSDNCCENF